MLNYDVGWFMCEDSENWCKANHIVKNDSIFYGNVCCFYLYRSIHDVKATELGKYQTVLFCMLSWADL